jgi:hypothetical protein
VRPVAHSYPTYDESLFYHFHITLAFRDGDDQLDEIYAYLQANYDPGVDEYATRVANLVGRELMYEADLPTGRVLSSEQATTAETWDATERALGSVIEPDDHTDLAPIPSRPRQVIERLTARLRGEW